MDVLEKTSPRAFGVRRLASSSSNKCYMAGDGRLGDDEQRYLCGIHVAAVWILVRESGGHGTLGWQRQQLLV